MSEGIQESDGLVALRQNRHASRCHYIRWNTIDMQADARTTASVAKTSARYRVRSASVPGTRAADVSLRWASCKSEETVMWRGESPREESLRLENYEI